MTCFPNATVERQRKSQNKQRLPLASIQLTLQGLTLSIAEEADERGSPMGTTMSEIRVICLNKARKSVSEPKTQASACL